MENNGSITYGSPLCLLPYVIYGTIILRRPDTFGTKSLKPFIEFLFTGSYSIHDNIIRNTLGFDPQEIAFFCK